MREVGVLEAKTKLSALLDAVERDREIITITRNGRPIAALSPATSRRRLSGEELLARSRALRDRHSDLEAEKLDPLNLREALGRE